MGPLLQLVRRNSSIYFKDRMTFFTSLISPLILFFLFLTFLKSSYEKNIQAAIPIGLTLEPELLDAFTGGWFLSSVLGVSSITIAFCSNVLMIQDRVNGSLRDLQAAPVKGWVISLGYFFSNVAVTLLICCCCLGMGCLYLYRIGWVYASDVFLQILGDTFLCVLLGSALAALVESFVRSQGGISALAGLVSALYGFICGAYMPIAQFSEEIRTLLSYLPGTYGIGLLRQDCLFPVLEQMGLALPKEMVSALADAYDVNLYFGDSPVERGTMYLILAGSTAGILGIHLMLCIFSQKRKKQ